MTSNSPAWAGPLAVDDPSPIAELRHVLVEAGFDGPAVREALGAEGQMIARPGDTPVLQRRLAEIEPLGTIASLFVLGSPVLESAARRALEPSSLEQVERLGLVESAGGLVTPRVRLIPHDDLLIVSDIPDEAEEQPDHVAGIHNPSVTLAHLTIRRPVETALDVGTGSGIQAILAARHSARVVATDLSGRALNFATFNALLNNAEGIEFRAGSYFEPAAGEHFGVLTCNPPYVISPETAYLFRDSGLAGDTVSRELIRDAPAVLTGGGFGSMLVSWIHAPGEDWSARLRTWLEGSGCDAILLNYGTQDPLTHASNWTRDRYANDVEGFEKALTRWLEYLAALGAEGIGYGAVVLRRRESARNWVRAYDLPPAGLRRSSDHLLRIFDAVDFLANLGDDRALLAERFVLTEYAEVEQRVSLRSGEWSIDRIEVRLDDGLRFRAAVDPLIAHLLAGLDGRRTLAEVAEELATAQNLDRASLAERAVPVAREMFELGFLER